MSAFDSAASAMLNVLMATFGESVTHTTALGVATVLTANRLKSTTYIFARKCFKRHIAHADAVPLLKES